MHSNLEYFTRLKFMPNFVEYVENEEIFNEK